MFQVADLCIRSLTGIRVDLEENRAAGRDLPVDTDNSEDVTLTADCKLLRPTYFGRPPLLSKSAEVNNW